MLEYDLSLRYYFGLAVSRNHALVTLKDIPVIVLLQQFGHCEPLRQQVGTEECKQF